MIKKGLTGNQLKLIALVTMTIDHVGLMLLPQYDILRIIGRLAFPIYAWMIAEGSRHTRSLPRYLGSVAAVAALCQIVYFAAMGSVAQSILVTFSVSIGLIALLRRALDENTVLSRVLAGAALLAVLFATELLPGLLRGTDFSVEYGFLGVMLPVCVYFGKTMPHRLCLAAVILLLMGWDFGAVQWYALLALPLLALYNGQRGRGKLKYLFYFYYPAHLAAIYAIGLIL